MIQYLLPVVAVAMALIGCNKNDEKGEAASQGQTKSSEPKSSDSSKPTSYALKDYFVSDTNDNGLLDPNDTVTVRETGSLIDQNSPEFQKLTQSLGHRQGHPLSLLGAESYFQVHGDPKLPYWKYQSDWPNRPTNNLKDDMLVYTQAKNFAKQNSLDFDPTAYLDFVRTHLESEYSTLECPNFRSMNDYLKFDCTLKVDEDLSECRMVADALHTYFDVDKSSEISQMEKSAAEYKSKGPLGNEDGCLKAAFAGAW